MGNGPPIAGATPPVYTFSNVVAPTGIVAVNGQSPYFRSGYLLGAFVTKALYYIPDVDARPFPDPIPVLRGDTASIIDVAQAPNGDILFVTGSAIFKLVVPIGQQSAAEAEEQWPIVNEPQVTADVNSIGQRLAANAGGPQFQYRFRVVNSADINAFALPGGFVYINRGILDNARNEGE